MIRRPAGCWAIRSEVPGLCKPEILYETKTDNQSTEFLKECFVESIDSGLVIVKFIEKSIISDDEFLSKFGCRLKVLL